MTLSTSPLDENKHPEYVDEIRYAKFLLWIRNIYDIGKWLQVISAHGEVGIGLGKVAYAVGVKDPEGIFLDAYIDVCKIKDWHDTIRTHFFRAINEKIITSKELSAEEFILQYSLGTLPRVINFKEINLAPLNKIIRDLKKKLGDQST